MANIADKVAAIRQAIFGKDVRESIASGIEAINSEVVSTTNRQNVVDEQELIRKENENVRKANETTRQSQEQARINTFNTNETNRINTFSTNETGRQTAFNNKQSEMQSEFNTNETNRQGVFNNNESARDEVINQFKEWYNSTTLTGRLPLYINGGDFGDPKNGYVIDGGDFE